MEPAEETPKPPPDQPLIISEGSKLYLIQAGRWATFLGFVGFVVTVLIILGGISMCNNIINMQRNFMAGMEQSRNGLLIVVAVVDVVMATTTFFFSLYLYKFGATVKEGVLHNDALKTNAAFGKLKSYFKLSGITIVILLVMFLLIIFGTPMMPGSGHSYKFKVNSPLVR